VALFSWFRRRNYGVEDPTTGLRREVLADPENDESEERVIKRERDDIERGEQGFIND